MSNADAPGPEAARGQRRSVVRANFKHEDRDWFRRRLSISFAQCMAYTVGVMPDPIRFWLADRAGDVWHRAAPTYRANVRSNLRHAMGPDIPDAEMDRYVRDVFRLNARNFTDLFKMPTWSSQRLLASITLGTHGWTPLERALERGNGVVLVTAHLGAFDVVGHAVGSRGFPVTALTGRTTTRFIFDAVDYLRRSHNVTTTESTPGGVRTVIKALRRNEIAGVLADFDFFRNGIPVQLFGQETTLPPGPVRFARETGAQVLGAFAQRTERGYALHFTEAFDVPKTRDVDADVESAIQRVAALLEKAISAMPEQWVILQRVWPESPAPTVRIFPEGSPLESEFLKRVDELLPPRPGERHTTEHPAAN